MNPIGIFAKIFNRANVADVCQAVNAHGFQLVQFNMACAGLPTLPTQINPQTLIEIRTALQFHQLKVVGLSGTFNMAHPNEAVRKDGLERLMVLAQHCKAIGTDLITLCTGTRNPDDMWAFHPENHTEAAWHDLVHTMEAALLIAENYDINLAIEPELGNVVADAHKAKQLLSEMNSHRLKVILDPANLFEKANPPDIYKIIDTAIGYLSEDIVMLHAKDRTLDGNFTLPGTGIIPFDYFLEQMRSANVYAPIVAHGFLENDAKLVIQWWEKLNA